MSYVCHLSWQHDETIIPSFLSASDCISKVLQNTVCNRAQEHASWWFLLSSHRLQLQTRKLFNKSFLEKVKCCGLFFIFFKTNMRTSVVWVIWSALLILVKDISWNWSLWSNLSGHGKSTLITKDKIVDPMSCFQPKYEHFKRWVCKMKPILMPEIIPSWLCPACF